MRLCKVVVELHFIVTVEMLLHRESDNVHNELYSPSILLGIAERGSVKCKIYWWLFNQLMNAHVDQIGRVM